MLAVCNRHSIIFTNKLLRELNNKKILLFKLSVRFLIVKTASKNGSYCLKLFEILVNLD